MISQNDLERERYLARVKVERDELSRLDSASSAREEGRQEGELIGAIRAYQRFLKKPLTPTAELLALPFSELQTLARQLEREPPG